MSIALQDLKLERLDVLYPGKETYPMGDRMRAVGLSRLLRNVEPLA